MWDSKTQPTTPPSSDGLVLPVSGPKSLTSAPCCEVAKEPPSTDRSTSQKSNNSVIWIEGLTPDEVFSRNPDDQSFEVHRLVALRQHAVRGLPQRWRPIPTLFPFAIPAYDDGSGLLQPRSGFRFPACVIRRCGSLPLLFQDGSILLLTTAAIRAAASVHVRKATIEVVDCVVRECRHSSPQQVMFDVRFGRPNIGWHPSASVR